MLCTYEFVSGLWVVCCTAVQALLDDVYSEFVSCVAASRGKSEQDIRDLLDAGIYETEELARRGMLDGTCRVL